MFQAENVKKALWLFLECLEFGGAGCARCACPDFPLTTRAVPSFGPIPALMRGSNAQTASVEAA